VVYVGANDGMLHAFMVEPSATNITDKPGDELWAFIPQAVLPDLWRLADTRFEDDHHYYVDATPTVGDVFNSTTQTWRTILVGGLGAGGRSVFALDITDTSKPPVLLWEFTHADLGLTFGSPVITKNKAGTWVVAFSSGYNNTNDGLGRLFVLNAIDGTSLPGTPIATTAGNAGTPSNLGPVNAWVEKETDNTALRFYAGDMQGYLWRFDLDDLLPPSSNPAKPDAVALGRAMTPGTISVPQPITSRPLLSEVPLGSKLVPLISFGTGRYLGDTDVVNEDVQSMYTIKDTLGATGLGVLNSAAANLVKITLNDARTPTATASTPINWDAQNGWYADLDMTSAKRERVYLDATPVASGIIGYASLIPDADACSPGGTSWFYEFDITTGGLRQATFYSVPITGDSRVNDVDGTRALITDQEGIGKSPDGISNLPTPGTVIRRSSWRELLD
jgi:type IV pilus assembly protein PilY1